MRNLGGFLHGGITAWREEGRPAVRTERILLEELKQRHDAGEEIQIIDVREPDEYEAAHIKGSILIPWHDIDGIPEQLEAGKPIAAVCGSGKRSGVAASLLQRFGAEGVIHVTGGGVGDWERLGGEVESGTS